MSSEWAVVGRTQWMYALILTHGPNFMASVQLLKESLRLERERLEAEIIL